MTQHFTRNTVSATFYCAKCGKPTSHRIDGVRKGPCLECIARGDRLLTSSGDGQLAERKATGEAPAPLGNKPVPENLTLAPPGPPAPCGYPGCRLAAFHDGDHSLPPPARPAPGKSWDDVRRCAICDTPFVVYAERIPGAARLCGAQACLVEQVRREDWGKLGPLRCSCPQRPYPHELSVHGKIRHERPGTYLLYEDLSVRFAPEGLRWPWGLNLSSRVEPSTEREIRG